MKVETEVMNRKQMEATSISYHVEFLQCMHAICRMPGLWNTSTHKAEFLVKNRAYAHMMSR